MGDSLKKPSKINFSIYSNSHNLAINNEQVELILVLNNVELNNEQVWLILVLNNVEFPLVFKNALKYIFWLRQQLRNGTPFWFQKLDFSKVLKYSIKMLLNN